MEECSIHPLSNLIIHMNEPGQLQCTGSCVYEDVKILINNKIILISRNPQVEQITVSIDSPWMPTNENQTECSISLNISRSMDDQTRNESTSVHCRFLHENIELEHCDTGLVYITFEEGIITISSIINNYKFYVLQKLVVQPLHPSLKWLLHLLYYLQWKIMVCS